MSSSTSSSSESPVEMEISHDGTYVGFDARAQDRVRHLARELTQSIDDVSTQQYSYDGVEEGGDNRRKPSMDGVPGIVPFVQLGEQVDPRLDPSSPDFNGRFWIKNIKKLHQSYPDHYQPTKLGVAYKNLRVIGQATDADYQTTILNAPFKVLGMAWDTISRKKNSTYDILKPMDGLLKPGTVTVVLGRPGAGCTTLLKTISSHTYGVEVAEESVISYDGITPKEIVNNYRGEVTYSAESDVHFGTLTVKETLEFAATLRTPQNRPLGVSRELYVDHLTKVYMAMYGLSHTVNTPVGDNFIRGVSGGERKRVSIAEVSLCGSYVQCWDNATRGLDSATALEFVRALQTSADVLDVTSIIAIYQCSQDAYDLFDNTILLYEGYQIYSGPANKAKDYFVRMGYECPPRQSTADFLTSITNPAERIVRKGFEKKVPRTSKQFYDYWNKSQERSTLLESVDEYMAEKEENGAHEAFSAAHRARQSNHIHKKSPYTVSYFMQVRAIMFRNLLRIKSNPGNMMFISIGNIIMSLVLSSLFYNLPADTDTFYVRSAAMFFGLLYNAFGSVLEIIVMFEARPIAEKHKAYGLYYPSADAMGQIVTDLPFKFVTTLIFNLIYYFMINFNRHPGNFFFYLLMNLCVVLIMSHMLRALGSLFYTLPAAMSPTSMLLSALAIYTGFAVPTANMLDWAGWFHYINPLYYVFEALLTNEYDDRTFKCNNFLPTGPTYDTVNISNRICNVPSSVPGQMYIDGTSYMHVAYNFHFSKRWRNFGISIGFMIFFLIIYLVGVELNKGSMGKGEIVLFQRKTLKKLKKAQKKNKKTNDIEANNEELDIMGVAASKHHEAQSDKSGSNDVISKIHAGTDIFHWRDVSYDVQIGPETRRILNNACGWIKPGTLTALMGASGAGKTTLLDVLASRVTMGVIYGHMFVNGHLRDDSFQRSTGYVQQQDIHLDTSTVRDALRFSAYLRQPNSVSKKEKDEYVENVIQILEMSSYADAVVGVAGEGLNVEQRKRLTIGVELAAKPKVLLFLDEPTSGLDSQTAWSICQLMRKLADNGQAVLCTIHQPSALLIQGFDRLLFLASGGKTVYFGDLGKNASTLIKYFESHGAPKCPPQANPAEWMLEVIGAAPGSTANQDYHEVWINSKEYRKVRKELFRMEEDLKKKPRVQDAESRQEFAAPLWKQYLIVTKRVFEQYYRSPSYIWSKFLLTVLNSLLLGFSFYNSPRSLQGLQNMMLSTFMVTVITNTLVQQMLPYFIYQRSLYEARERPSKTFSWKAFIAAQITAEIPYHFVIGTLGFFCWYYPIGFFHNAEATNTVSERGALSWLFIVLFYVWMSTFGQMCLAAFDSPMIGAQLSQFFFFMSLNFNGVMRFPTGFWKWMYYTSPFSYWIKGILSSGVGDTAIKCSNIEFVKFPPPTGQTCGQYMTDYLSNNQGYLLDPNATTECSFCPMSDTNSYLVSNIHTRYSERWMYLGIFAAYIIFNIILCVLAYWFFRVPKANKTVHSVPSNPDTVIETSSKDQSKTKN